MNTKLSSASNPEPQVGELVQIMAENLPITEQKVDEECQVNLYSNSDVNSQTFICNRYVKDKVCHAEIQTEIIEDTRPVKVDYNKEKYVCIYVVYIF